MSDDKLKVLWFSNAPWAPSGYGRQTKLIAALLPQHDIDLRIYCNYGLQGTVLQYTPDVMLYPSDGKAGEQNMKWAVENFDPDVVVSFYDPWAIGWINEVDVPWVSWFPVDAEPASAVSVKQLGKASGVVSCSLFGQRVLKQHHEIDSEYIPCAEDFEALFVPRPDDKERFRKAFGFPEDAFIFGMVGNNQGVPNRKAFVEAMSAFGKILDEGYDAYLYLHTIADQQRRGVDLVATQEFLGLPDDRVLYADQMSYNLGLFDETHLVGVYNAIDVLLQPSYGEGFGIPIIEAQGCGTPVIGAANTTMPELIAEAGGWLVESQIFPHAHAAHYGMPVVSSMVDMMKSAIRSKENGTILDRGKVAHEFTKSHYDARMMAKMWADYLHSEVWRK